MKGHKKALKFVPHSVKRLCQRFKIEELPTLKYEFIRRDTGTKTLCRFVGTDIYFILRKPDRTVLTFLTKQQAEETFDFKGE